MSKNSYEMDMTTGSISLKLLSLTLPYMASSILQLLFNAADTVVVGRFAGATSLAAVGATASLVNLMVNLFMGLAVGTNVLVARYYGAKDNKKISDVVHTSIALALVVGVCVAVLGVLSARTLLGMMDTPEDCIDLSVLYISIYFLSMPVVGLYNFGSSILRAVGDTKRPMYYLIAAGVLNIFLNLFFVIVLNLKVAGVALATDISQIFSAAMVIRCLIKSESSYRLVLKKLHLIKEEVISIAQIGIPASVQGMLFSVSNMIIQSSINSFGSIVVAGNTAASNIEAFVWASMNAFAQTAVSFISQNFGAGKMDRLWKIYVRAILMCTLFGGGFGFMARFCEMPLLSLYTADPEVIEAGIARIGIVCTTYWLCGMMDVTSYTLRGVGYSLQAVVVTILAVCGLRISWVYTVFAMTGSLQLLYISYPVSWIISFTIQLGIFLRFMSKVKKLRPKPEI